MPINDLDPREVFSDEMSRQLDLLAVTNGATDDVLAALNGRDADIQDLAGSLLRRPNQPFPKAKVSEANKAGVDVAFKAMRSFGLKLGKAEADHAYKAMGGTEDGLKRLTAAEIREAVDGVKFLGKSFAEHRTLLRGYRGGLLLDELGTLQQARRAGAIIRPDVALQSLAKGRDAMRATVQTYAQAVREAIRKRFYRRNPEAVGVFFWSSILDGRTTQVCLANDGATRKAGERAWSNGYTGPYPAHYGERSVILNLPASAAKAIKRQSADEWLASLPEERQREILGPRRYALWAKGKLGLQDFVSSRGRKLTLDELAKRYPRAAKKAKAA